MNEATNENAARLTHALRCPVCSGPVERGHDGREVCTLCGVEIAAQEGVRLLAGIDESAATRFYSADDAARYGRSHMAPQFDVPVREFLKTIPAESLVVELGSGAGAFDGCHPGYVATDYSLFALKTFSTGERVHADAQALPFADRSIDAFFSVATLEHIPRPERALAELDRCLKPGGKLLLYPAWYVRPWAAKALALHSYSGLTVPDRIRKATIPLRDRRPYQLALVLPGRLRRELALHVQPGRQLALEYRRLAPNLDEYLMSDSDAFVSLDPQAVAAYFLSRGYEDLRRGTAVRRLVYGYEPLVLRAFAAE